MIREIVGSMPIRYPNTTTMDRKDSRKDSSVTEIKFPTFFIVDEKNYTKPKFKIAEPKINDWVLFTPYYKKFSKEYHKRPLFVDGAISPSKAMVLCMIAFRDYYIDVKMYRLRHYQLDGDYVTLYL